MATSWTAIFEYGGKNRRISVPSTIDLDGLLQLVATRWKIAAPIELAYVDSATGDEMVLDVDDDLLGLLSQNFKWKVLAAENSSSSNASVAAAPIMNTPAVAATLPTESGKGHSATEDDKHDETLERKKEKWIELIPDDWVCKTSVQRHPFFISYRQASETSVAKDLFHEIKSALVNDFRGSVLPEESKLLGLHPFWDAKCLAFGQKWGVSFMSGLFHSSVIILLCSDASMERMLEADRRPDNCLLEWELALQMKEERGHDILPILLSGKVTATLDDGKKALLVKNFSTFDHTMFPDRFHAHPLSPGLHTVAETVKHILALNGPKAHPENDVLKIVTEAREVYSRRKADLKTGNPSSAISLSRSSLSELEDWLTPLSEVMDVERQALLKNVLSGSRRWLLKKVFQFLSPDDPSVASANRVMWLKGVAGVGKSVMAAMVSRELQAHGMLGGLFFCKHDDKRRSSARNLVLTLVFGLAKFSLQFGEILLQVKQDYPDILSRSVFEMMKVLLVQPLEKVVEAKKLVVPVVLVVDALDECGSINKRNEILSVFQELNRLLPGNVKLLVTGRPEEDIAKAFEKIPVESIEPTAEENTQDQIDFTRDFLRSLNAEPSVVNEGSKILVSKSSGIFVWLVSACSYLRKSVNEEITLDQIVDLPEGDRMDGNIDHMYDRIFSGILQSATTSHLNSLFKAVLSIIVLAYEPLTAAGIVSLLDMENPEDVKRCIRMLDPVLLLDGSTKRIRIFHKSLKDYLSSSSRCKLPAQIELQRGHTELARLCVGAMDKALKFNMCNLPFSNFHTDIPDFEERVAKGVPEHVKYAVKHFYEHCLDSCKTPLSTAVETLMAVDQDLLTKLQDMFVNHGHHYLEANSLLDSLDLVIPAMVALQKILLDKENLPLHALLEDMKRVLQKFLIPLKASALQVYFTAIPFSPSNSEFYRIFAGKVPVGVSCPRAVKGQPKDWPSCINILEGHSAGVQSAAFSPDGQFLVSGSVDNTIRIWNASTGQEMLKLEGHSHDVTSAAFSPDSQRVVSGSADTTVRIWNATTGQELSNLEGHSDAVNSVAFSPDGKFVVSGSSDSTVRVWNASTGQELRQLVGHSSKVNSAAFSPDSLFVVSASDDRTVRIWNASTGQELSNLEGHSSDVNSAAFSPDGQFLVSGSFDKTIRIWNASTGQEMLKLEGHSGCVSSVAFSPDGKFVVSASNSVTIWNAFTGQELYKLEEDTVRIQSAAFSPDGHFVVSGNWDKTVKIWTAFSANQRLHNLEGHSNFVLSSALSIDGQFVVSGGADYTVRIWNTSTGQELHKLEGHSNIVLSVAFSPDRQFVVSGSFDKTIRIWNVSSGQELEKLEGHSDFVCSVAFSPDGQLVLSGSYDKTVRIWNASTGQELHKLDANFGWDKSAAFSPDGQLIVSGGEDNTVRVWNASSGAELHKLDGFFFAVSPGFTADGQYVVLKSILGEVKLIHLVSALELQEKDAPLATSYMESLKKNFHVCDEFGQTLHNAQAPLESVLEDCVWFTFNATKVSCWLPLEFRGNRQILLNNSIFTLGRGVASLIQF